MLELGNKAFFSNGKPKRPWPFQTKSNLHLTASSTCWSKPAAVRKKRNTIFSFCWNPKQLERLHIIFTDLKAELQVAPIPVSIHEGFIDDDLKLVCYTDHQVFQRYHKYKVKQAFSKNKALTLKHSVNFSRRLCVTHIDHGVGYTAACKNRSERQDCRKPCAFSTAMVICCMWIFLRCTRSASTAAREGPFPKWTNWEVMYGTNWKEKKQVKDIATDLIRLYAQRKSQQGLHTVRQLHADRTRASFIYEDTPDQAKPRRMLSGTWRNRLPWTGWCAVMWALAKQGSGNQGCIQIMRWWQTGGCTWYLQRFLPTSIIKPFGERLKDFPNGDFLNRFKSSKEKKKHCKTGRRKDRYHHRHPCPAERCKVQRFPVMIIDEEQKFGVSAKENQTTPHHGWFTNTTATPIPRTLQFSLMGASDLSIINTAP